ncbi:MAG: hypothetical protein IPP59_19310 [Betaproteobacteria bacterium]|nr:hypothetical protein [Candidatus Dechloromonas phosphorivorans]
MDATKRQRQMRRGVTALRHQFAQGGSGVFSAVLEGRTPPKSSRRRRAITGTGAIHR